MSAGPLLNSDGSLTLEVGVYDWTLPRPQRHFTWLNKH